MMSELFDVKWSKFSYANEKNDPSTGYLDMAKMIALKPGAFRIADHEKAVRILKSNRITLLAAYADRLLSEYKSSGRGHS